MKISEYKFTQKRGITDLEGMLGDFATEWWTKEDWKKFNDDKSNRDRRNQEYIDKLKAENRYGEEYDITVAVPHNSLFDDNTYFDNNPKESYKMIILDLKDRKDENN